VALVVDITAPGSPTGVITVVNAYLENKCKPACRRKQLAALMETLQENQNPIVLAGDFNTTGKDNSPMSVRGELIRLVKDYEFWIKQSINWFTPLSLPTYALMPFNFWRTYHDPTATHVPFSAVTRKPGSSATYESFVLRMEIPSIFVGCPRTMPRAGTLDDSNQRAWKGFVPTFAMPRDFGGVARLKLDWFFIKPLADTTNTKHQQYRLDPYYPRSMQDRNESVPDRLSGHAPMTVDLHIGDVPRPSWQNLPC
jgi:hypothetical protein